MVLQDHAVRGGTAAGLRAAPRLARPRTGDAAQLDRQKRRRGGGLPARRAAARPPCHSNLHHPAGHDLRRDVHEPGAGVAAGGTADRGASRGGGRAGIRGAGVPAGESGSHRRRSREGRHVHGRVCDQSIYTREDPDLGGELRPVRIRDRRDHGRTRARSARLRVRDQVQDSCPAGDSEPRRHADRAAVGRLRRRGRHAGEQRAVLRARRGRGEGENRRLRRGREIRQAHRQLSPPRLGRLAATILGHAHSDYLLQGLRDGTRAGRQTSG